MAIFKRKGKEDAKATSDEPERTVTAEKKSAKKETPKDEVSDKKEFAAKKTVPKTSKKEDSPEEPAEEVQKAPKKASYVVCTHPDGGWQVKKTGSTKAIRRFDTKAEADAYAKKVASNNGATVIRKKKDGKIQKKL